MIKHRKELFTIGVIMFTEVIGWSLILPYVPFMAKRFGATPQLIGILISSFSIFQFISAPIMGKLSDHFGRKPLIIISQISTTIGFILLGIAKSLPMLFLSRAIDGLLGSNMTISRAYIIDITDKKERTKIFGFTSSIFALGMFLGPAIGGLLAEIDYSIPAFIAAAMSLGSIILTITLLKESVKRKKEVKIKIDDFFPMKTFLKEIKRVELRKLFTEYFLYITGFTMITSSLAIFTGIRLNFGPSDVGFMFMILAFSRILFQIFIFPKVLKRYNDRVLSTIGMSLAIIAMANIIFVSNKLWMYLTMTIFAIGAGITRPIMNSSVSKRAGENEKGKIMGVFDSIASIAQIISPLIGGFILNNFYPGTIGIVGAILIGGALLINDI